MMKVILTREVSNLGQLGDLVNVRPGYGRNFLIPQGLAVMATEGNVRQIEHQKRLISQTAAKLRATSEGIAAAIAGVSLTLTAQAGAEGKLFGSITNRDLEEALAKKGIEIDRKQIVINDAIKAVGDHTATIKLGHDVEAKLKFTVVAN